MGVIGFNKLSDDHFQNGWHWLNGTELFFFFNKTSHSSGAILQNAHVSQKGNRAAKKCESVSGIFEEWITSRSENTSPLGQGMQKLEEISPFTPAVSNLKTFYSADLNVGEWWPARNRVTEWQRWARETETEEDEEWGEGGEETEGRVVLCGERCCQLSWSCVVLEFVF